MYKSVLSLLKQLIYYIIVIGVCQYLFESFFMFFSHSLLSFVLPLADSYNILTQSIAFVNAFFSFFRALCTFISIHYILLSFKLFLYNKLSKCPLLFFHEQLIHSRIRRFYQKYIWIRRRLAHIHARQFNICHNTDRSFGFFGCYRLITVCYICIFNTARSRVFLIP